MVTLYTTGSVLEHLSGVPHADVSVLVNREACKGGLVRLGGMG